MVLLALLLVYGARRIRASVPNTVIPAPQLNADPGLPTEAEAQLTRLKDDYATAQDRIRRLNDILDNKSTTYSYLDQGRLNCYMKARDGQQRFVDAALVAAQELKQGTPLRYIPAIPDMPLGWPNPTASAGFTLWHENARNNNFTVLYVTVSNGVAGSVTLHRPDGTVVELTADTSVTFELGPSPPLTFQVVDGIQIVATQRMAFDFPGHLALAGAQIDIKSPLGTSFTSATVGQPVAMSR